MLNIEFNKRYSEISVPVRILHGDRDIACPVDPCATEVKAAITNAQLDILEQVNHFPPTEAPEKVVLAIQEHAKKCWKNT